MVDLCRDPGLVFFTGEGDQRSHLRCCKSDAHGSAGAWNKGDVEQLAHRALEGDPVQNIAVLGVDDESAAARLAIAALDVLLELEPLEGAVAGKRRADHGIAIPK